MCSNNILHMCVCVCMCAPADMAVANDIKMLFVGIGMLYAAGRLL